MYNHVTSRHATSCHATPRHVTHMLPWKSCSGDMPSDSSIASAPTNGSEYHASSDVLFNWDVAAALALAGNATSSRRRRSLMFEAFFDEFEASAAAAGAKKDGALICKFSHAN